LYLKTVYFFKNKKGVGVLFVKGILKKNKKIMDYEKKYKEYQEAKERAEQHMFPFILMFDGMIDNQYNDLKNNYNKEHEELFIKNVDFVLKKIS
jgi:hypothetical protein